MTNKQMAKTGYFIKMCRLYNVEPTKRQASKFKTGKGSLRQRLKAEIKSH